jgi:syntaxin 5
MAASRRRAGSESEQVPLIIATGGSCSLKNSGSQQTQAHHNASKGAESHRYSIEDITPIQSENIRRGKMTSRDRTAEFGNATRFLEGHHVKRTMVVRDPRRATYIESYAECMKIARSIGKNIGSTNTKLEKLTLLAKRKSLFNDRPAEIQELTYIIKEDLNSLNQQIAKLQAAARNERQSQQNGHHLVLHLSSVVLTLQSKLAAMSTEFKQVLEVRTKNLKQQKSNQDQFSQGPVSSSLPPSAMSGHHQGSVLLTHEVSINMEEYSPLLPVTQKQAMIYDETGNYQEIRAETMQNIESTIVELGGIFQQLAHIVKEQDEMVLRIDTNVQETELNVEAGHIEIVKYFQNFTSDRWLMIKIFAVLIFFCLLFTFLA